jgi:hypothetical protein
MMSTPLLPDAERALEVGIRRAIDRIDSGDLPGAQRALTVALDAAELLDAERETLDDAGAALIRAGLDPRPVYEP